MNELLITFLAEYREPATRELLWGEIHSIRTFTRNTLEGLPETIDELDDELRLLLVEGRLACEGGLWRVVPRVEKRVVERTLF